MPQITETTFRERIAALQAVMKTRGIDAVVLEPGSAMLFLTGVRWGKSERTFAVVLPQKGEPVWVLPGFEEARARELIHVGTDIRVWQEDESPYALIAAGLKDRGASTRVAIDESARFFVFDGIRKLAPKFEYVPATALLKAANAEGSPMPARN